MNKKIVCVYVGFLAISSLVGCGGYKKSIDNFNATQALEDIFTTIELNGASISELNKEMEVGHLSSKQLTQMYIDRINTYDKKLNLNSVIAISPTALKEAEELDALRKDGQVKGPLHGVPLLIKANYDVKGLPTTAGSKMMKDNMSDTDAFVVKKLRDAGAVILGHANMSEWAYSASSSRSTLGGNTHNAYDNTKTPGGSSGGSGVAVAANFAAAALGTDTGGSIRNPSSFNNLFGIRPSKGLTSIDGVIPLVTYRDTTGPLARTAEDMALLLGIMGGNDTKDDYTTEANATALVGNGYMDALSPDGLKGMRIGYLKSSFSYDYNDGYFQMHMEPDRKIVSMVDTMRSTFTNAGATLVDLSNKLTDSTIDSITAGLGLDSFEYGINSYLHTKPNFKYQTLKALYKNGTPNVDYYYLDSLIENPTVLADSYETTVNPHVKYGQYDRIPDYQRVLDGRNTVQQIMDTNNIDAIMYLNSFDVPPEESEYVYFRYNYAGYDRAFGPILGLPEISLPMGFAKTNKNYPISLPLGVALFSGFGQEEKLMKIAYAYEKQAGDTIKKNPEAVPALKDDNLNNFLDELLQKAYAVNPKDYSKKVRPLIDEMLIVCEKAKAVDKNDPYKVYEATKELAEAYDKLANTING